MMQPSSPRVGPTDAERLTRARIFSALAEPHIDRRHASARASTPLRRRHVLYRAAQPTAGHDALIAILIAVTDRPASSMTQLDCARITHIATDFSRGGATAVVNTLI